MHSRAFQAHRGAHLEQLELARKETQAVIERHMRMVYEVSQARVEEDIENFAAIWSDYGLFAEQGGLDRHHAFIASQCDFRLIFNGINVF